MLSPSCKRCLAHPEKPLKHHLENTGKLSEYLIKKLPLNIPCLDKQALIGISYLIGVYHDFGKATRFFQEYLAERDIEKKAKLKNQEETKHSLLSAIATYYAVDQYLQENKLENEWKEFFLHSSFIVVRRHHTNLISVLDDLRFENEKILQKQIENFCFNCLRYLPYFETVVEKMNSYNKLHLTKLGLHTWFDNNKHLGLLPFLVHHLLYSILLDADKHETVLENIVARKTIQPDLIDKFRKYKNFDTPMSKVDELRNEIYTQVINQVSEIKLSNNRIISFTAPTGAGKTLTSIAFALKLREAIQEMLKYSPRVIYCLPFLSIIDQNAKILEDVYETTMGEKPTSDILLIHHHLSDYFYQIYKTEYDADESEILIEGWDSEIIITTFVQFFHTLFSNNKKVIRKFNKIPGSIIILDEIQSFPHKYWLLFKEVASYLAEYFNTYFILSTATQPAIFEFSKEVVPKKDQFFQSLNRTHIRFNTTKQLTINQLVDKLVIELKEQPKDTMVVLNTVGAAEALFKSLKGYLKNLAFQIFYLSSHVVPYERFQRIEKIKAPSNNKKLLITTQLVEAGVDLDFEKVIRDLGPMDSISQVAGRANRNGQMNKGEVEIVKLVSDNNRKFSTLIYDTILIDCTERLVQSIAELNEPDLFYYVEEYFRNLRNSISNDLSNEYIKHIKYLNYDEVGRFKLIEDEEKIDIFIELNEEASKYWKNYEMIIKEDNFWLRKKEFNKIKNKFYKYVISVSSRTSNKPPKINGFHLVTKENIGEFYDSETGFKFSSSCVIW